MTKTTYLGSAIFTIFIVWLVGTRPETPIYSIEFTPVSNDLITLNDSINKAESLNPVIKINNQARIVWADSIGQKTKWSMVYLHGFTASQMEGDPVHTSIAKKFGMNLYLARLSDHGLKSDSALYKITPDRLWETAKTALAIGEAIGDSVIIMSTSTGGTLALKLAEMYPHKVAALINYSANIEINESFAPMLNNRWGLGILNMISADGYVDNSAESDSLISQYWTVKYKTEALPQLQELLESTMKPSMFENITCPVLNLAYFKDKKHQDPTVKVSAIKWMHKSLGTENDLKRYREMPTVGVHPMATSLRSDDIKAVKNETSDFILNVLSIEIEN